MMFGCTQRHVQSHTKRLIADFIRRRWLPLAATLLFAVLFGMGSSESESTILFLLCAWVTGFFGALLVGVHIGAVDIRVWKLLPVAKKDFRSAIFFCGVILMPTLGFAVYLLACLNAFLTWDTSARLFLWSPLVLTNGTATGAVFISLSYVLGTLRLQARMNLASNKENGRSLSAVTSLLILAECVAYSEATLWLLRSATDVDTGSVLYLMLSSALRLGLVGGRVLSLGLRVAWGKLPFRFWPDRSDFVGIGHVLLGYALLCSPVLFLVLPLFIVIPEWRPTSSTGFAALVVALLGLEATVLLEAFWHVVLSPETSEVFTKRRQERPSSYLPTFMWLVPVREGDPMNAMSWGRRIFAYDSVAWERTTRTWFWQLLRRRVIWPLYPWLSAHGGAVTACYVMAMFYLLSLISTSHGRTVDSFWGNFASLTTMIGAFVTASVYAVWFPHVRLFRSFPLSRAMLTFRLFTLVVMPAAVLAAIWMPFIWLSAGRLNALSQLCCVLLGASVMTAVLPLMPQLSKHVREWTALSVVLGSLLCTLMSAFSDHVPWPLVLGIGAALFVLGYVELHWLIGRSTAFYRLKASPHDAQGSTR